MYKIAVLVSGSGTNLQCIIDKIKEGYLNCEIEYVISDRPEAYAIERAKQNNIKTVVFDRKTDKNISEKINEMLKEKVDLIVMAGYLSILKGEIFETFKDKIINLHPSLIPSFCGKGMYGMKVHEKAIEYGVKVSGCTLHIVDNEIDGGAIIMQKTVEVDSDDTPDTLQKKISVEEHQAIVEAVKLFSENRVVIDGRKVKIIK